MANTKSIAALRAKLWYKALFADVPSILFMNRFMGKSSNSIIQVVRDLSSGPGDTVEFGLSTKLSGDGTEGDDELEGNEEEITTYNDTLVVDQLRHAVRLKGNMEEKKVAYSMRMDAKDKLKIWWAERIDQEILDKLCGNTASDFANTPTTPTTNRHILAAGRANENALTTPDVFDTKVLDAAKEQAITATVKVRPIKMEDKQHTGESKYVAVLHPYHFSALKKDPVWNQAQREANLRGSSNPIISGAAGEYNGILVYQHEGIYRFNNGSSVPVARSLLLGQQAGIFGIGRDEKWKEKEFDYGNKYGVSAGRIFGVIKPVFNSEDYGVITMSATATKATTA